MNVPDAAAAELRCSVKVRARMLNIEAHRRSLRVLDASLTMSCSFSRICPLFLVHLMLFWLPQPEARSRHSSHIIGSQLYVFCGHDGMKPHLSEVWTLEVDDVKGHLARAFDELQSNRKVEEEDKKNDDDD